MNPEVTGAVVMAATTLRTKEAHDAHFVATLLCLATVAGVLTASGADAARAKKDVDAFVAALPKRPWYRPTIMTLTVVNEAAALAATAGLTELRGPFMLASLGAIRDRSSSLRAALAPSGFSLLSYRREIAHGKVEDPTAPSDGPARVVFHNDPFTPMDFVADVLTSIFGRDRETARAFVQRVHETGSAELAAMDAKEAQVKVRAATLRAASDEMPLRLTIAPPA